MRNIERFGDPMLLMWTSACCLAINLCCLIAVTATSGQLQGRIEVWKGLIKPIENRPINIELRLNDQTTPDPADLVPIAPPVLERELAPTRPLREPVSRFNSATGHHDQRKRQQGFVAASVVTSAALCSGDPLRLLKGFSMPTAHMNQSYTQAQIDELLLIAEPSVKYFGRKMTFDGFDYDDICQELRIMVLEMIERYDPNKGATFKTFVNSQLHFRIGDLLRKYGRTNRAGKQRRIAETPLTVETADGDSFTLEGVYDRDPGAEFDWNEFRSAVANESTAIRCQVLHAEGMLMRDIGSLLGISESRVCQVMKAGTHREIAFSRILVLLGEVA